MAELCSDVSNLQKEMLALIRKEFSVRYLLYKEECSEKAIVCNKNN